MTKIFGDFIDELPSGTEYLILGFSPHSIPLKQRWRNNGLSADFLADYFTTFFPGEEKTEAGFSKQAEIQCAVSYIVNELLENAMKFSQETWHYPISIKLVLSCDKIVFVTTNALTPHHQDKLQSFIKKMQCSDPQELYIQQLEKNAADESHSSSGLGYLTMLNDYGAKIGWKFESLESKDDIESVTTMVQIEV
ncbi:DUF6272 family protein [Phormidium sp. CCY1219]|uniref:DUF6272 family protein n=1 Tax=Phormidium sp. CCY1219 TaxID=2886104 RepID=UPI002D1E8826|nr:DUF6272 family protein [Phormidium sp. CCY1219]MEB3827165.1 DUF6272 family protein [Phormidium sp. CCY1219]